MQANQLYFFLQTIGKKEKCAQTSCNRSIILQKKITGFTKKTQIIFCDYLVWNDEKLKLKNDARTYVVGSDKCDKLHNVT